jgi:transcriptional regulator with XRE-family HTH domain
MQKIPRNSMGWRLRAERLRRNMTQRELGESVGMTASVITQYERNHHEPTLRTMEAFARIFGVPVEFLMNGGNAPPTRKVQEARTPTELQVLTLFRRTPEEAHAGMLAVLRATIKYAGVGR